MRFNIMSFIPALPDDAAAASTVAGAGGGGSSATAPTGDQAAVLPATSGESAASAENSQPEFGTEENFQDFLANVEARQRTETEPSSKDAKPAEEAAPQDEAQTEEQKPQESPKPAEPSLEERLAEAERARAAAEARLAALEALKSQEKQEEPNDAQDADPEPDPANYEFGLADAKYIADSARWNARQEFRAQEQQRAAQAELAAIETTWKSRIADKRIVETYPDFDEKVIKGADKDAWALSPIGALLIKNSEYGPDVAYHLASNPEESRRIAAMEPYEQMRAIARLEGRFEALASAPKATTNPPSKVAPSAPPPPQTRTRGAGGRFGVDPATEDFNAFSKYADSVLSGR